MTTTQQRNFNRGRGNFRGQNYRNRFNTYNGSNFQYRNYENYRNNRGRYNFGTNNNYNNNNNRGRFNNNKRYNNITYNNANTQQQGNRGRNNYIRCISENEMGPSMGRAPQRQDQENQNEETIRVIRWGNDLLT